jgi:four helix bundle protein
MMGEVRNYQDLVVWQKAMDLVEHVYKLTRRFPKEEMYGLTSQVRRAAVSIPSNIAEGHARKSRAEYLNFLSITQGSRAEVETQLLIAKRLGYLTPEELAPVLTVLNEINRMISTISRRLRD